MPKIFLNLNRLTACLIAVVFCCLFSTRLRGQTATNAAAKPLPTIPCWTGADFWIDGQPPDVDWPANLADPAKRKELVLWGSWCGNGERQGCLLLGPFVAPEHFSLVISGMPFDEGNVLKLVRLPDQAEIILTRNTLGNIWKEFDIDLPKDWVGRNIKIGAWDSSQRSWLGVSEPFVIRKDGTVRSLWKNRTKLVRSHFWWNETFGPLILTFAIYAVIGLAGYSLLRRFILPPAYLVPMLMCAVVGVLGYLVFWAFFWGPEIGRYADRGVLWLSVAYVLYRVAVTRTFLLTLEEWREIKWPLTIMAIALLFDIGVVGRARTEGIPFEVLASRRPTTFGLPGDNVLQEGISRALFNGKDPRSAGDIEWQSSDRPPLQASLQLLSGPMILRPFNTDWNASSQMSGVVFQLSWVFGVWALLRALRCSPRTAVGISLCLIPTPLLYVNTIFVWAKLSAAAYVLTMTVILCFRGKRPLSLAESAVAGVLLSLGMLCHSGIFFFALPVLGLWFVLPDGGRFFPNWKPAIVLVGAAFLTFAPWMCYQKFVDPPGNRLIKLSFTGVETPNSVSLTQGLHDAYKVLSVQDVVHYKLSNFQELFKGDWHTFFSFTPPDRMERRSSSFFYLFRSFGIYLLGLLALPVLSRSENKDIRGPIVFLFSVVTIAVVIWCLLMFGPAATVVHVGAFGVPLVSLVLLLYLIRLAHPILLLIAGLYNLAQFLWVYGWTYPYPPRIDSVALGLLLAAFALAITLVIFTPGQELRPAPSRS